MLNEHHIKHINLDDAAWPEWLRGMPAKCMRKCAKDRTLQAAILLHATGSMAAV